MEKKKSPGYAAYDLETAVDKAKTLYNHDKRSPMALVTIAKHLGYAPQSGPFSSAVATMKKYGLLEKVGVAELKLSDIALDIILLDESDSRRIAAIKKVALAPEIHRHLWDVYKNEPPSDMNLIHYLVTKRGFNHNAAVDVVRVYRDTIAFAKLNEGDKVALVEVIDEDAGGVNNDGLTDILKGSLAFPSAKVQAGGQTVASFPLSTGAAQIRVPENMTADDLETLFGIYLEGWKKILLKKIEGPQGS